MLKWWVDASYAAHDNMQEHTGVTMSMGKYGCRSIIGISKKQKLNTKRLTEAELIGADYAIPQMIRTRYFLEAQGHGIDDNIFYQESISATLLEKNRNKSSTKNTKILTCGTIS